MTQWKTSRTARLRQLLAVLVQAAVLARQWPPRRILSARWQTFDRRSLLRSAAGVQGILGFVFRASRVRAWVV